MAGCGVSKVQLSGLENNKDAIVEEEQQAAQEEAMKSFGRKKDTDNNTVYYIVNDDENITSMGSVSSINDAAFLDVDGNGYFYSEKENEVIDVFKSSASSTPENTCRTLANQFKSVFSINTTCVQALCRKVLCRKGFCGGESLSSLGEFADAACAPQKIVTCRRGICCTDCLE
jgi:hypothetical protein